MGKKNRKIVEITVFITGGTIDSVERKEDRPKERKLVFFEGEPIVPKIMEEMVARLNVENLDKPEIRLKFVTPEGLYHDSSKFTRKRMRNLAELIKECASDNIIVTHGTDYMIRSAKRLIEYLDPNNKKTIVFTGSMDPLANGPTSDAHQNLLSTLKAFWDKKEMPKPTVYMCLQEKVMNPVYLIKDLLNSMFKYRGKSQDAERLRPIDTVIAYQERVKATREKRHAAKLEKAEALQL